MSGALTRSVASLEHDAERARRSHDGLRQLSPTERTEALARRLVEHGADLVTAVEAFENLWRLGARSHGAETWGELVALLPEALASRVADLRWRAELGGASAEDAARLEDAGFRRMVSVLSDHLWPPEGWTYCEGFAWVLTRVAAGVPEGEISHAAYYGPVRGPEMAACAAARLDRSAERPFRTEAPLQPRDQ